MLLRTSRLLVDATAQASGPSWVRIKDGSIAELGEGPGEPAVGEEVLDLGDALLMPGLVMAHTHVEFGVFRGHGDGLGFVPWIQGLTRRRMEDFDFPGLLASARLSCLELVAAGVTGVGEATTHGEAAVKALRESGLRGACYLEEFGPDPRDVDQVLDRMRMRLDGLEELAAGTRLRIGISPHAVYTVHPRLFEAMLAEAHTRKVGMSMHLAETRAEDAFVRDGEGLFAENHRTREIPVKARGKGPYAFVRDEGWLEGPAETLVVHGVHLEEADLEDLAGRSSVHLVHCPRSNARLGAGIAPIPEALARGASVLVGTDGACSVDRLDPFEEMRTALVVARARAEDPEVLAATDVLGMAFAGHPALGFGPGRIEEGAPADLCALDLGRPSMLPCEPPGSGAVLQASPADVTLTMVGGEILYRDGAFTRIDPAEVLARAREAAAGS